MNQSTNYNFNLPEGTDLVNLLTQLIPNWSNLDTILKGVEDQAITNCTEITTLGVHAIARSNTDGKILKWIATSNYTAGETFTVDGSVVAASTPAGATLATGAYVTGSVVLACLNADESAMTIFVSGTTVATDSERLGGELPNYYATASDMENAQTDITDLDNLMGNTSISAIGDGTVTGAISAINNDLGELASPFLSDDLTPTILDTTIAYNSSYQAPKDGFYILQMSSSSSTDAPALYYNSNRTFPVSSIFIPTINYTMQVLIPLKKDTIIYTKNSSVTSYKVVGYLSKA